MKRIVRILALLSIFSIATGVPLAQQAGTAGVLEGKVTDLITQKGILAATVTATDTHKTIYKTITTQDGSYRLENLPLNGRVTLACSQLGYSPNPQTALVELKSGKAIGIRLSSSHPAMPATSRKWWMYSLPGKTSKRVRLLNSSRRTSIRIRKRLSPSN